MGGICGAQSRVCNDRSVDQRAKPMHVRVIEAAAAGDVSKLSKLLAIGASIDSFDRSGRSALHLACAEGHTHMVRFLIEKGSDLNTKDRWGHQPLQEAMLNGHKAVVEALLQNGTVFSSELKAELESKLLHLVGMGDLPRIKNLVAAGISINATDYLGRTALHIAADRGRLHIADYLLEHKVDLDCVDLAGDTAVALAARRKHRLVQDALIAAGAKPCQEGRCKLMKRMRSRTASFAIMEACAQPIAVAMMEGRKILPIRRAMASLFFSDIVGFTTLSSTMDPAKVSRLLNSLFKKLDRLAYLHGVQKVDVIGDAYIAATNFTEDQEADHAARLARFAIDAVAAARSTPIDEDDPAGSGYVQIRVGIHSGPVSGVVVGQCNLKYTLMGDTVQVAARMESSGVAGQIQCSAASAALIAAQAHDMMLKRRRAGGSEGGARPAAPPPGTLAGGSEGGGGDVGRGATYWVSSVRQGWRHYSSCPNLLGGGGAAAAAAPTGPAAALIATPRDAVATAPGGDCRRRRGLLRPALSVDTAAAARAGGATDPTTGLRSPLPPLRAAGPWSPAPWSPAAASVAAAGPWSPAPWSPAAAVAAAAPGATPASPAAAAAASAAAAAAAAAKRSATLAALVGREGSPGGRRRELARMGSHILLSMRSQIFRI